MKREFDLHRQSHNKAINYVPALRASTGRGKAGAFPHRLWRRYAA